MGGAINSAPADNILINIESLIWIHGINDYQFYARNLAWGQKLVLIFHGHEPLKNTDRARNLRIYSMKSLP